MRKTDLRNKINDVAVDLLGEAEGLFTADAEDLEASICCIKALARRLEVLQQEERIDA